MPAELLWSYQAQSDLDEILEFIHAESPKAAKSYVEGLAASCEQLKNFPASCRAYNANYRVLVFRSHLIFYRHDSAANAVTIAKVIDGRRDYGRLFKDFLKE